MEEVAQLLVPRHFLEHGLECRPVRCVWIRNEKQNRALLLLYGEEGLVVPPPPKNASFRKLRRIHQLIPEALTVSFTPSLSSRCELCCGHPRRISARRHPDQSRRPLGQPPRPHPHAPKHAV